MIQDTKILRKNIYFFNGLLFPQKNEVCNRAQYADNKYTRDFSISDKYLLTINNIIINSIIL